MSNESIHARPRDRAGAEKIRRAIRRSRDRFWRPSDFDAPESTVLHILGSLTRAGELERIRKGLYWRGTQTVLGMSPPLPDRLVAEIAGTTGVGATGLTAANELGLSTQIPRRAAVAVTGIALTPTAFIDFVHRPRQTERLRQRLTSREVSLLEVLSDLSVSELGTKPTWTALTDLLRSGTVRLDRLAKAGRTEPATTRARLAHLLSDVGESDLAARVPDVDPRVRRKALAFTGEPVAA